MTDERQKQFDISYLKMCHDWAGNSRAVRLKVGALIVKDGQIISDGFNGTARGMNNTCENLFDHITGETTELISPEGAEIRYMDILAHGKDYRYSLVSTKDVIHAELNAIIKLASKGGMGCEGATIYITDSPCYACSLLILQSGIKRVVYDREYRITDGLNLLREHGVQVEHLSI